MVTFREQEILFEHKDGKWTRFDEDPEDPEFEIESPVNPARVYKDIANLKFKGWRVREVEDSSFDGILLYKRITIEDDNTEVIFEYVNGVWYKLKDDLEDDESMIKRKLTPRQAENNINLLKKQGWKVKEHEDPSFKGMVLYKPEDDEEEST